MPKKDFSNLERMNTPLNNIIAPAAATPHHETPAQKPPQMPEPEDQTDTRHYAEKNWAEPRTRRVQLLMRPTIYEGLQRIADQQNTSINHLVENVLAEFIAKTENDQARRERLAKREQGQG